MLNTIFKEVPRAIEHIEKFLSRKDYILDTLATKRDALISELSHKNIDINKLLFIQGELSAIKECITLITGDDTINF